MEGDLLNVFGLKRHSISDMDFMRPGIKLEFGHVGTLIVRILNCKANRAQPGDFLSARIGQEHGIHVEFVVTDEVEGKSMFSLHSVAEEVSTWQHDAEVRVITQ